MKEFYERIGVKRFKIYVDPIMCAQTGLGTLGLPTTLIIDREGRERGRLMGAAEWDDAAAVKLVLSAMEDPE